MKKKLFGLFALALLLVLAGTLRSSLASFTTYAYALGGKPIRLGSENEIHEEFSSWTKHVTIQANADSEPVFVRARAYADENVSLTITDESGAWTDGGDGWYYYAYVLAAGESTRELLVRISGLPADAQIGTDFNVVVVYECTRALYRADGTPYPDWNNVGGEGGNP